jgi:hypothetical protein
VEDNLSGRRPTWKMTSVEDDLNISTRSVEDDLSERRPQWMTTSVEDNLNISSPSVVKPT